MKHGGYLMVPRNRQGMIEQMRGAESEENILFVAITAEEREALQPLLAQFEQAFGFDSRGQTVEQLIDTRNAAAASDLALRFAQGAQNDVGKSAARKMHEALEAALGYGSYVEFAF